MRCLVLVVVQAVIRALGNAGAIYLTGAASSALTVEKDSVGVFAGAR